MNSTELIHAIFMDGYLHYKMHIAPPNKDQSFGQQFNRMFIVRIAQGMQSLNESKPVIQQCGSMLSNQGFTIFLFKCVHHLKILGTRRVK